MMVVIPEGEDDGASAFACLSHQSLPQGGSCGGPPLAWVVHNDERGVLVGGG